MDQKEYKVGELSPQTGQYQCVICGYVMEFKAGEPFVICSVCQAGAVGGPRGPEEGVWVLLE
jgi:rubrerythrin